MNLAPEVIYKAKEKDQGKALDEAVAYGQKQGWQLNSVIWQKEDEEGNHHFVISFSEVNSNVKEE
jgi:hypothetical protein